MPDILKGMSDLNILAQQLGVELKRQGLMLVTAESCTGGWVAQAATAVTGSSDWFERGFVTYTNIAKQEMLGVEVSTLERYGAVSEQVVREMAQGALCRSHAQIALAVSGIAGPGGGSEAKPVGTVCIAWAIVGGATLAITEHFSGDRQAVRYKAVAKALSGALELVRERRTIA